MKHKYEIISIVVTWSSFLIWEFYVNQWAKQEAVPIIRMDLIILLPALIMLTLWMIFEMKSEKKT